MHHRPLERLGSAALLAALLVSSGCGEGNAGKTTSVAPGTARMAERLAALERDSDPMANPYANDRRVEVLRAQQGGRNQLEHDLRLAAELLFAGQTQEALGMFGPLERQLGAAPVRVMRALAYMRLGEQDNCVLHHGADSCLMPIAGGGVHSNPRGARSAVLEYEAILRDDPDDLESVWMLNVAAMALGEHPDAVPERWRIPRSAFESEHLLPRFRDRAAEAGVARSGLAGGCCLEDFDGDGDLDLVESSWGLSDQVGYHRNDGDGTFSERTAEAGLTGITGGLNLVHADYDNNGYADVLVLRGAWLGYPPAKDGGRHPNSLLHNEGGRFEDRSEEVGLTSARPTQTAAWGDFDGDGWLDLFVGNESWGPARHPCELYRNISRRDEGGADRRFVDVAGKSGGAVVGMVKGVAAGDFDRDGALDLYLSILQGENVLLRNARVGGAAKGTELRFRDVAKQAGVTEPRMSFPVLFFDYDQDGWLDLFVSGYRATLEGSAADVAAEYLQLESGAEKPRLFHNSGDGTFEDRTAAARLDRVLFTMGCNFGDLDQDGFLDLYLGTGDPDYRSIVPNRMFRNFRGERFQDVTTAGGFGHIQKGHAIAFADVDDDGDQDVYAVMGGAFSGDAYPNALFENPEPLESGSVAAPRWIRLRLEGVRANRSAIGARLEVTAHAADGSTRKLYSTVSTGGSFGSGPLRRELGLGPGVESVDLVVTWPGSGLEQSFEGLGTDRAWHLREGEEPRELDLASN